MEISSTLPGGGARQEVQVLGRLGLSLGKHHFDCNEHLAPNPVLVLSRGGRGAGDKAGGIPQYFDPGGSQPEGPGPVQNK